MSFLAVKRRVMCPAFFLVLFLGLSIGFAGLYGINGQALGLFHDDGIYAVVAKSISDGNGYHIVSLPSSPPQTKYPFLYSFVLSSAWTLNPKFPDNVFLLKAVNVTLLIIIFFLSYALYRCYLRAPVWQGILFSLLVCTNPVVFTYTDYPVSDLLLLLFVVCAFLLQSVAQLARKPLYQVAIFAVVAGLAILTRPAAIPLLFAGTVYSFSKCRFRGLMLFLSVSLMVISPWILWSMGGSARTSNSLLTYYIAHDNYGATHALGTSFFARRREIVWANLHYFIESIELLFVLPLLPGSSTIIYFLMALGCGYAVVHQTAFFWPFLVAYLMLIIIWPFHPVRYLIPVVPFLVMFFLMGIRMLGQWIKSRWVTQSGGRFTLMIIWSPAVIAIMLNAVWLSSFLLNKDENTTRGIYGIRHQYSWQGFTETFAWVSAHTQQDAILATAYDPMYYLYTGRKAIRPALHKPETFFYPYGRSDPDVGSARPIIRDLEALGVNYLIIDPLDGYAEKKATAKLFDDIITDLRDRAELCFTSSDGKHRVYRLLDL